MEVLDVPDELNSPPEIRLSGTLLTQKPHGKSFLMVSITLLLVVIATQLTWLAPDNIASLMPAVQSKVFQEGQWWRLFTATVIHGDISHLLSNLYMLAILSYFVYGYFGFWAFPVTTFLGAAVVNAISILTYPSHVALLGASGWVYLLGGFWLVLYGLIQRQLSTTQRILRVTGMALMVFFPTSFEPNTSYRAHFIGFLVGAILGLFYFLFKRKAIQEHETFIVID